MKKIISFLIIAITLISCDADDFLDIKPKGELIPETLEEYDLLLNTTDLQEENHFLYALDPFFVAPNLVAKTPVVQNMYQFKDFVFEANEEDTFWSNAYQNIFTINVVIDGLSAFEDSSEKNRILAEAKTQRAYYYFRLVNYYAKSYTESTATTDLGVPLVIVPDLEAMLPRATVQEVYDQMVEDLTFAAQYLPRTQNNRSRPTSISAYGLLSKVYLHMGANYANECIEAATKAIELNLTEHGGNDLYDYNNEGLVGDPLFNREITMVKRNISLSFIDNLAFPKQFSPEWAALFEPEDLRLNTLYQAIFFFAPSPYYISRTLLYGKGVIIPEIYLNRAEANFMLGNTDLVWDDLNYIREHRISTPSYVELSGPDVWETLRIERIKELSIYDQNFFDLKRWTASGIITDDYVRYEWNPFFGIKQDEVARLSPGDNNWSMAIPQSVILEFNPDLIQNPRDGQ